MYRTTAENTASKIAIPNNSKQWRHEVFKQFRWILKAVQQYFQWLEAHCGATSAQLWPLWEFSSFHSAASNMLDKLARKGVIMCERTSQDQTNDNFQQEKTMSDNSQVYQGKKITIRFDAAKCIHSRHCVLGNPGVFVPNAPGDWIQPDAASPEEIAALIHACPSGALTYERLDGGGAEQAPLVNVVRIKENGPLAFRADMEIQGSGACYRATLCRCGASQNKPFCDSSHVATNFIATGEPAVTASEALAERAGKLAIVPIVDGPLHVTGNLEVCSGNGGTVNRTRETWLCRCGASQDKPYCDGTHRKIGFSSQGSTE